MVVLDPFASRRRKRTVAEERVCSLMFLRRRQLLRGRLLGINRTTVPFLSVFVLLSDRARKYIEFETGEKKVTRVYF